MKIIVTGSTGFIGGEVLSRALAHPSITSIVCLSRKALPEAISSNPKLKVIIITDFLTYTSAVLDELMGAEACIWSLGSVAKDSTDLVECKKIEIGYTGAAATAFSKSLAPPLKVEGKVFRFLYLSGKFAERDVDKMRMKWFLYHSRTIKGEAENGILAAQKESPNFEVSIVRPGGVLAEGNAMPDALIGVLLFIRVRELAAAMVDEVVSGVKGTRTLESDELRANGRKVLAI